jgi:hypothetical protein
VTSVDPAQDQQVEFSAVMRKAVLDGIGGWRGTIDSGLPIVVFAAVNVATSLKTAAIAAAVTGVAVALLRLARRQPVQQALGGLAGLAIALVLALRTHKAANFYLPNILYGMALAAVGAASLALARPLAGVIMSFLDERWAHWRDEPDLRRRANLITGMWTVWYTIKGGFSGALYVSHHSTGLAGLRLALAWPPDQALAYLTVRLVKGAHPDAENSEDAPA